MKKITNGKSGRDKLASGIRKMADAVGSTLGPMGRTVIIESPHHTRGLTITKDGVTVAKSIELKNPIENLAVSMLKEAASNTATSAGDGPQPKSAGVLTRTGWVRMDELKVGDEICGTNKTRQVVTGIFDKGRMEVYEVVLGDGRIVECSSNHLWQVTTSWGTTSVKPLHDIIKDFKDDGKGPRHNKYKYYVPIGGGVEFDGSSKPLPIDPYTLGVLIGDGSLSGSGDLELSLGASKEYLISKLSFPEGVDMRVKWVEDKNYFRVKLIGGDLAQRLKDLGLFGCNSHSKFIPWQYMYNTTANRSALLQGLIDTDGYVNDRGLFEFSTVSDKLADDFQDLISGLGYAFYRRLHTRENDKGSYSDKSIHRIQQLVGYKYGHKIVDVRATGIYTDMMCISVSNEDHLYFTDGYIPTHNTTTSVVIADAFLQSGMKVFEDKSVDVTKTLRAVKEITQEVVEYLNEMAKPMDNSLLVDVATISANNDDKLGLMISDVFKQMGKDGIVTVEKSQTSETYFDTSNGMVLDRGMSAAGFVTDLERNECVMDDAYILMTDIELTSFGPLTKVFEEVISSNLSLLIIAPCSVGFLNSLLANKMKGRLNKICVVEPPQFGERMKKMMDDIALATGGVFFNESNGDNLHNTTIADLGRAERVTIGRDKTTVKLMGEADDAVTERVAQLKKSADEFDRKRIATLLGKMGVIYVGGDSDIEQKEMYDRVDDAVCAVRSALEEGVLPGGGVALLDAARWLKGKHDSFDVYALSIVIDAITAPIGKIYENAGEEVYVQPQSGRYILGIGKNLKNGIVGNMIDMGVIDPAKVTKTALTNAMSIATTILGTDSIITMLRAK